jgi:RNA polymerase sigma factor (sigma-70 family)
MSNRQILGTIRRLLGGPLNDHAAGDGELLQCYLDCRDNAAFEALQRRHGPMVLGVCQRVLRNTHDAEDAFQATFLVLVRKAASVHPREQVGNWLYGVAYRTALKARTMTARRSARERVTARPEATCDDSLADWVALLDRELSQLPDKYRVAVVLCDLEGKTRLQAAEMLGWPVGTLSTRLRGARAILSQRLARRGLTLSGGAATLAMVGTAASAKMAPALMSATVRAAAAFEAGQAAGLVPAPVLALAEGVSKTMSGSKVKIIFAAALLLVLAGLGVSAHRWFPVAAQTGGDQPMENKNGAKVVVSQQPKIVHGRTAPGEGWQRYGTTGEEAALGIYIDVDTSAAKFKSVPTYITSLGGDNGHWAVTGVTSIYPRTDKDGKPLPLETGFRIYLHFPPDPDFVAAAHECKKKWHINWVAYGE